MIVCGVVGDVPRPEQPMMASVKAGDRVTVHYTGRLESGALFDTSEGRDPIAFEVGGAEVIRGISAGVIGMRPGERRNLTVPAEQGYGLRNEGLLLTVARRSLPDGAVVGNGLVLKSGGDEYIGWLVGIEGDEASIDLNHPLAGATLHFDVTLVGIEPAAEVPS